MTSSENNPVTSATHGKLLVFVITLIASSFIFIGIIPLIFLLFFTYAIKRGGDFSNIEVAAKYMKIYFHLIAFAGVSTALFNLFLSSYGKDDYFIAACLGTVAWGTAIFLVNNLFLYPLRTHSKWIENHGIFLTKTSKNTQDNDGLSVIKSENFKSYSTADELLKWAALKEGGHISEKEFAEVRNKILNR